MAQVRVKSCRNCGRKGPFYRNEPEGYIEWFEWAEDMERKGYVQELCPGCEYYTVWRKKNADGAS